MMTAAYLVYYLFAGIVVGLWFQYCAGPFLHNFSLYNYKKVEMTLTTLKKQAYKANEKYRPSEIYTHFHNLLPRLC
jgi:uncharacterized membrane protein YraQ (UPF0718 family)